MKNSLCAKKFASGKKAIRTSYELEKAVWFMASSFMLLSKVLAREMHIGVSRFKTLWKLGKKSICNRLATLPFLLKLNSLGCPTSSDTPHIASKGMPPMTQIRWHSRQSKRLSPQRWGGGGGSVLATDSCFLPVGGNQSARRKPTTLGRAPKVVGLLRALRFPPTGQVGGVTRYHTSH